MKRLLESVDYIKMVGVLGGEPLLHPGLHTIIKYLLNHPKVGGVQVITNGTVKPKNALLHVLKNRRAALVVSDYGKRSRMASSIKADCLVNGIRCTVLRVSSWRAYGGLEARCRSDKTLRKIFNGCKAFHCRSLFNGFLHLCPRCAAGYALGAFDASSDCINIREGDANFLRSHINRLLYKTAYIRACDYCNNSSACLVKTIKVAEQ
jgi:hypothetical protein